jgi:hypothetical protein
VSNDLGAIMTKLKQPPSVPNWARYNYPSVSKTTKAITSFALGFPSHSLFSIYPVIGDMITFGTPEVDALKGIGRIKDPKVRQLGREIIHAFAAFNRANKLEGLQIFEDFSGHFRVARDILVPVKPTFIILEQGRPTPVFFIGWTSMPFSDRQKRLLTTAIDDAVLSFGDFKGARGHILCAPRPKGSKSERIIRHWTTDDHPRFAADDLNDQLQCYASALDLAAPEIKRELDRRAALKARAARDDGLENPAQRPTDTQGDLFR